MRVLITMNLIHIAVFSAGPDHCLPTDVLEIDL
jgi:hypothetical protein